MKIFQFILKVLCIAMILFLCKHLLQALIEFTDVIPVKPKSYIWGDFDRAKSVFVWQFLFSFWVYVLTVILSYFILSYLRKVKLHKLLSTLLVMIILFLLYVHKNQFPYKKLLSVSNPKRLNYEIYEEFIIYSFVGLLLVYLVRMWLIKRKQD